MQNTERTGKTRQGHDTRVMQALPLPPAVVKVPRAKHTRFCSSSAVPSVTAGQLLPACRVRRESRFAGRRMACAPRERREGEYARIHGTISKPGHASHTPK